MPSLTVSWSLLVAPLSVSSKDRQVISPSLPAGRLLSGADGHTRNPAQGFEALSSRVALYPEHMDSCEVDGEQVTFQEGGFYGGWITRQIVGPFKGGPGTAGW